MKNTVLIIVIAVLLLSCSSFVYYPNGVNAPLLTHKDETQISIGIKGFGGDIRTAYAVSDKFGVQLNANLLNLSATEFGTEYRNGNYYGEVALGYYKEMVPHIVFEAYLGAGTGKTISDNTTSSTLRTTDYSKVYLQQDVGLHYKNIDFGLAIREAYVNASKTKIDGVDQNIQQMDIFIEPILFLAVGFEKFKINFQAGFSDSQFDWITSYAPFIFSAGIEYRFDLK